MSKSSKTKSSSTTNQVQTDTPTVSPWLDTMFKGFGDKVNAFAQTDPNSYVADASPLQQKAFDAAGGLGGWQSIMAGAQGMAKTAGGAGANLATAGGAGANLAGTNLATAGGYNPTMMGNIALGPMSHIDASTIDGMDRSRYMDPYLNDVVNTTMADFDQNAGRVRSAQAANAAANGAFSSSRYGLREAQTEDNLARARASTGAGLRSAAFDKATGMMQFDAGQRQNAAGFNAGADNQRTLSQGQIDAATAAANAAAQNRSSEFGADATNRASMFNTDATNRASMFNTDATNRASMFNTDATNRTSMFNANQEDTALQRMLAAAGLITNQATAIGEGSRADLAAQLGAGNTQYQINQAKLNANPIYLQMLAGLNNSIPVGAYTSRTGTMNGTSTGTQKTSSMDWGDAAGKAIQTAMMFSDERLKRDVVTVGYDAKNRRVVDFRYLWSDQVYRGHIAQELLATDPHAVHLDPSGFLKVNYGALN